MLRMYLRSNFIGLFYYVYQNNFQMYKNITNVNLNSNKNLSDPKRSIN